MKILIAAGTGFLGKSLEVYFTEKGHEVMILSRSPLRSNEYRWDGKSLGEWKDLLESTDVLINLAGKSVDCRYTDKNKQEIYDSRINSTKILQKAVDQCSHKPKVWLNASSATIYIHSETHLNTEENGIIGDDFSMNICKSWEKEFFKKETENVRKVALRTSIVLGNNGGAFPKLKMITRLGLGGKQGRGNQMVSWIHIEDFCSAIEFIIENGIIAGPLNVTSPQPLPNEVFMKKLRKAMRIPLGLNASVWQLELISLLLRTETELLLKSRNVYPQKLMESGFKFLYPDAERVFGDLV